MPSRDPKIWMWAEAIELLESAERLKRQFFQLGSAQGARWEPPVDVYESGEELWVFVALPGVPEEHMEVRIEGAVLVIRGEKPLSPVAQGATIHRLEIPYGAFERRIGLPSGHYQMLQRMLDNGCLVIGLRKLD